VENMGCGCLRIECKRALEPKRLNVTKGGGREEKYNEELHNLYSSSYKIRMIKSNNMDNVRKVHNTQ
jgi:hypothetical protein